MKSLRVLHKGISGQTIYSIGNDLINLFGLERIFLGDSRKNLKKNQLKIPPQYQSFSKLIH